MNLNRQQFEAAMKRGLDLCNELKADYPELRLYPVFSRFGPGSGQCGVTTDPLTILVEFPEMLIVPENVRRLGELLRMERKWKKLKVPMPKAPMEELVILRQQLNGRISVEYYGDVNIEFRCGALQYRTLHRLQQDPRLPVGLNTVGNVRVIAGSLEMLIS